MYNTVIHNFYSYTSFIVFIKYWLYSLCCTIYPCNLFILLYQYFGHMIQRADSLEKSHAGKEWKQKEKRQQRMRWLDSITNSMDMKSRRQQRTVAWCAVVHGVTKSQTWLSNRTTTYFFYTPLKIGVLLYSSMVKAEDVYILEFRILEFLEWRVLS